jgi:hypothetical protein
MNYEELNDEEKNRIKFQTELEFVQLLSNPSYIHCNQKLIKNSFSSKELF